MKKIVSFLAISTLLLFNACSNKNNTDTGVVINGITWATHNVATPGTFTTNPYDAGMFYQWNSKVGWTATGAIDSIIATDGTTTWNSSWKGGYTTPSGSDTWTSTNDPSPSGWRVPTYAEIETLTDTSKVKQVWTTQNSAYGEKFTDKTTGNSIFLPASGYRNGDDGTLLDAGSFGCYWGCSSVAAGVAYYLTFYGSDADWYDSGDRAHGLAVRPVTE
ncbi:MAG: hypothetical protein P4L28_07765 [Paludibacteraceae bacterium]|nr:hypothetical protein [Paludibacteraceae bacterium]